MNIPPPQLNGGLYSGKACTKDAPWCNVYIRPSVAGMTEALKTANGPPNSRYQYHWNVRPGNNTDDPLVGIQDYNGTDGFGPFNIKCVPCEKPYVEKNEPSKCEKVVINIW